MYSAMVASRVFLSLLSPGPVGPLPDGKVSDKRYGTTLAFMGTQTVKELEFEHRGKLRAHISVMRLLLSVGGLPKFLLTMVFALYFIKQFSSDTLQVALGRTYST